MFETLLLLAVLVATPAPAPSPAESERFDLGEVRKSLKVLSDGKGHYVAFNGDKPYSEPLFYGDGKVLWAQRVFGGGASGTEQFSAMMWEPRVARVARGASLEFKDSVYRLECGDVKTPLTLVADAEAQMLLNSAFFAKVKWKRQAHFLARDDAGTYYFVDRLRDEKRGDEPRGFRLFVGPKGALKAQAMTNIVSDSEGEIFASKSGTLRFIVEKDGSKEPKWMAGKATTKLKSVPLDDNVAMIYSSLGVYDREPLGTPCDDLM